MNTEFDFTTTNNEYIYTIDSNTKLCIKQINNGVAILYFTDETGNKINIPNGIVVYEYDSENKNKIALKHDKQLYPLCWSDYTIELNNNI
jgi:hypothetical protein